MLLPGGEGWGEWGGSDCRDDEGGPDYAYAMPITRQMCHFYFGRWGIHTQPTQLRRVTPQKRGIAHTQERHHNDYTHEDTEILENCGLYGESGSHRSTEV
jgi:hypothetical protein